MLDMISQQHNLAAKHQQTKKRDKPPPGF